MRIYLDTSCLSRPFDDQSIPRNATERSAVIDLIERIELGAVELVISEVVLSEVARTPDLLKRQKIAELAAVAGEVIKLDETIEDRGVQLRKLGFKPYDALHLAAAEAAQVDYLCTADDRLRKKALAQVSVRVHVISIRELLEVLDR